MKILSVAITLGMVFLPSANTQEGHWPVHTVCNTNKIRVKYRSCDPLQDIGFTLLSPCAQLWTEPIKPRLIVPLRQSVDELYLSVDVTLDGIPTLHLDEPLCQPNFPRYINCGSRKGELINVDGTLDKLPPHLTGQYNLIFSAINQNGFQIACVNSTIELL
ncbi:lymphocyte antigen 86 [Astyanax mexicanus]|uniref:Lymphocyte antigen 86 n=1 Tax=Astyanax mexicanus TaxID=7994 RepID=A0A3B1IPZ7_ASTMX|nr:lymphocyte antigen 86 [Astyanax mexicanus]